MKNRDFIDILCQLICKFSFIYKYEKVIKIWLNKKKASFVLYHIYFRSKMYNSRTFRYFNQSIKLYPASVWKIKKHFIYLFKITESIMIILKTIFAYHKTLRKPFTTSKMLMCCHACLYACFVTINIIFVILNFVNKTHA